MTTGATGQLGLALPVQGELSGTWGDTVNNGITQYTNIAIAATLTLTGDGAVTLANTTGDASASNITSTLTGAGTVTAQFAIVRVTGTLTVAKVVTAPSYSKTYTVVNAATGGIVTFKAAGQTGISIAVGESALVYFNGTDYVKAASSTATGDVVGPASSTDNAFTRFDSTTGKLLQNSTGATLSDTGAAVFTGALDVLGNSTAGSNLKLYEDTDNGTNYVSFKAPDTIASNVTWTLPAADGTSAQVLSTNGSGTLSWATAGASAATPTALGTVYGSMTTTGGSPYLTALGYNAGLGTTGVGVTAVGLDAAKTNTSGTGHTAMGYQALYSNTTGSSNTAYGYWASYTNTTGTQNTAIGIQSLYLNATGGQNVAVGLQSLYNNTASGNTGIGFAALTSNTTGSNNVGIGQDALYANTTASNNTAVGYKALNAVTTAVNNCAVGRQAGRDATASSSTYIGNDAGGGVTSGARNTIVGCEAGLSSITLTTGESNVYVGYAATGSAAGNNSEIVIGCGVSGTFLTGKGGGTGFISPNGGAMYNGGNTTTWATISDQRLKKNIVDNTVGLTAINSIRVRNFEYRLPEEVTELASSNAIKKEGVQLGVIAQELQAVLPDCVKTESTGVMSVDADNLTWYMINAIKELKAENDSLKARLDAANL